MAATNVTIRRGRQYELGKPQAGTATITFSDPGELLNPTNTSSPYNSGSASLVSYRPMRVTAVWRGTLYTIYTGYVERYPQTWTDAGFRGIKPLECVDGLAMLANTTVHQSYFETIMADNPAIYIPYNESAAPANVYLTSSKALLANGTSLPGNPRQGTSNLLSDAVVGGRYGVAGGSVSVERRSGVVRWGHHARRHPGVDVVVEACRARGDGHVAADRAGRHRRRHVFTEHGRVDHRMLVPVDGWFRQRHGV